MSGARFSDGLRTVFGSTAGAAIELTAADVALHSVLPLSRRVGVVSVAGGSGTSAVATALASLLAHRRPGLVLGADAAGGQAGMRWQALGDQPLSGEDPAAVPRTNALSAAEASAGLPRSGAGLCVLDLAGPQRRAASVAEWTQQVAPIARFFDLVITDWGLRPPDMDLADAAATSHVLIVVSRADRHAATAAASAVASIAPQGNRGVEAMLVLADVSRTGDRVARALGRKLGTAVPVLPFDAEWAADRPASSRRFSAATRLAHIRLAVSVMERAVRSQQPSTRPARQSSAEAVPA